jgi:outer membrane receptor protein involved in Fe transport
MLIKSPKRGNVWNGASLAAIAMSLASVSANAQDTQPAPVATASPNTAQSDENIIIVTGSRIARPQVESSVPLSIISGQAIANAGQSNVADSLRDIPIVGQSIDRSSSNFSNFDNGVATASLRNLGDSRTLVLINGRRSVGVPGDTAVDLNNIPVDLIDRIDVVTGGTSAVYGSDAVAGVVNVLLKNNFNGLQLHAQQGISSRGDNDTPLVSVLGGTDFSEGAGHITANLQYSKASAVPARARKYSRFDSPSGSAYTPVGAFGHLFSDGNAYTFDSAGNVVIDDFTPDQRFNRASERLLTVPVERYTAALLGHYDFSSAAQLYAEFTYSRTKASGHIEPLAVDNGGSQGQSAINFDGSAFPGISADNPYVPAVIRDDIGSGNFLDFFKRSNGIFDRSPRVKRDYYRGVIGLKGDIGSNWNYDFSYEHSQVKDDTFNEAIMMTNYGAALQATTIGGQIVCADPAARAAGCVPINPFGAPNYTAAQLKWLNTYNGGVAVPGAAIGDPVFSDYLRKGYQDVASLAITGSLFDLPGGPLGVSVGGEYHREKISAIFDPFTQSGFSSQQLNGNEAGKYNSKEGFIELRAPILSDRPLVHRLILEGAARYSDYTTVGSVWSYSYGGTYAPTPDISFRAKYARAVRAPNLNELFSPIANTAQQVVDPCDQAQGLGQGAISPLAAGCSALPGIANYLATHSDFSYTLAQVQTIFGFTGGNPNLNEETTNTFTVGGTFTPRFLRNFILTADYYRIKVKNAIALVDPQISVDQCFLTGSDSFCGAVFRDANGFITQVDQQQINAASYLVAGIDVQAIYNFKFGNDGGVGLDFYYNHKFKQEQTPFAGGPVSDEVGKADTYASQQLGTGFKDQFTFNANVSKGPFSINYRLKYMGPVTAAFGPTVIKIKAFTYHDLQAKFAFGEDRRFEFYTGVDNMFDKQPPFIIGGNSQWPGTNTVADTYDLLGRMFYAGVTVKF